METGLRWILILISLAVLALIVFDGWRRIKRQRPSSEKKRGFNSLFSGGPKEEEMLLVDEEDNYDDYAEEEIEMIPPKSAAPIQNERASTVPETYFVLNVLAQQGHVFNGAQLLPTLLSFGMRYGDMAIFHRHEHINGNGAVLFSLAAATEPGTFNLHTMESQNYTGLTLFLRVPGPAHPTNALNLMAQTAKRLAKALDGQICDEKRQPLSDSALERHYYFRLRQILGKM